MTRSAFLFKLLAVVGVGQAVTLRQPKGSQGAVTLPDCSLRDDLIIQNGPSEAQQCLRWSHDKHTFEWAKCDEGCEKGEERCPMGHCQKPAAYLEPKPIWGKGEREGTEMTGLTMMYYEPGKWIAQRVCSVCGVVYVPITPAVPKGGH